MVNGSQVVSWTHAGVRLGLILYYIISVADVPTLHAVSSGDLIVPRTHRQISNMASSVVTQRAWNRLPTELKLLFNGPFSGTTQVSQYQKGFTEASDSEWQWHHLGYMQVCTSLQTDNHASIPPLSFLQAECLSAAQPTVSKHWRNLIIR